MKITNGILLATLALALTASGAWAQTIPPADANPAPLSIKTFYLTNTSQADDGMELVTALRNLGDPHNRTWFVPAQSAIVIEATPDQIALAQRLINDLDRPKKTYRLTYAIVESEDGKRIGIQHFSMIVVTGQRAVLKQGSKVPVATGTRGSAGSGTETQMTYLDIGMNFDATLDEFVNGVRLRTKVEQLSVAEEKSGVGAQDPIIRQIALENTSFLTLGKPLVLGSVDIQGSTRHLDVEVVMELLK